MGNMMDYLDWRGDVTIGQSPFNEVDNLVLSQLAYVNFDQIVPSECSDESITIREAAKLYFELYDDEQIEQYGYMLRHSVYLLGKLMNCARFCDAKLSKFQNIVDVDMTKQFSAMHVELEDGTVYITFRGTDSTLVGWKENFNMTVLMPVPSQLEAVRYLEETTENRDQPLRLGGHSKGGNLAIYAAVMCRDDLKPRILEVYSNDGPGFDLEFVKSKNYAHMRDRIRTIVPQSSVVGMLLEHEDAYAIVKSSQTLILQHDLFTWQIQGPRIVRAKQVAEQSRLVEAALKSWLNELSRSEREQFVEALFEVLQATEVWTIEDLSRDKWRNVSLMIRALNRSKEQKVVLSKAFKKLFREGRKYLITSSNAWSPVDEP